MSNRLENRLIDLKNKGEKALIPYIMGGDPDPVTTVEIALALSRSGADVIEIGIPFSDPVADGPVIQKAASRSLAAGTRVKDIFNAATEIRQNCDIPLVLMTYYNPVLQYGLEQFTAAASNAGIDGMIIPDLPPEESGPLRDTLDGKNISLVPLLAPNSGQDRISSICAGAGGFIYCVSVTGVTGSRDKIGTDLNKFTSGVKNYTSLPVAIGFGISGPRSAAEISAYCDAVVVGSSLVETIAKYSPGSELLEQVSRQASAIKQALTESGGENVASL